MQHQTFVLFKIFIISLLLILFYHYYLKKKQKHENLIFMAPIYIYAQFLQRLRKYKITNWITVLSWTDLP